MTRLNVALLSDTGPYDGLLLIGPPADLAALGRLLMEPTEFDLEIDDAAQAPPYGHAAMHLKIRTGLKRGTTIQRKGDDVVFRGEVRALAIFGTNIFNFGEGRLGTDKGSHLHVEYHTDHFYLRSDAIPLVVEMTHEE